VGRRAGALLLLLALAARAGPGGALDVRRSAAAGEGTLEVLFPRPGQTLCDADQLELVALFDGSPAVPDGFVAVGSPASQPHPAGTHLRPNSTGWPWPDVALLHPCAETGEGSLAGLLWRDVQVLEVAGKATAELHSGALSVRLPDSSGRDSATLFPSPSLSCAL